MTMSSSSLSSRSSNKLFHSHPQISNVKIKNVAPRSAKKNIFEGATTQSLLGEKKLAALERPFMVHLKNGKVRAVDVGLFLL